MITVLSKKYNFKTHNAFKLFVNNIDFDKEYL
jgi:hypothetical protein